MVKEIKAWVDNNGIVHASKEAATRSDFMIRLKDVTRGALPPLTMEQMSAIWNNRFALVEMALELKTEREND